MRPRTFQTRHCRVAVDTFPEDDLDLSFDEDSTVQKDLECGRLVAFRVAATVYVNRVCMGDDHLGGCIYKSETDFMDHIGIKKEHPGCGFYFSDMVREACREARVNMADMHMVKMRRAKK